MKKEEEMLLEYIKIRLLKDKKKKITINTKLFEEDCIDSMNILDLIGYIEKKIDRKLSSEEVVMKNFKSVKTIIKAFIHGKRK